jgi:hypothetical protein
MQAAPSTVTFSAPALRGNFMGSSSSLQMASRPSIARAAVRHHACFFKNPLIVKAFNAPLIKACTFDKEVTTAYYGSASSIQTTAAHTSGKQHLAVDACTREQRVCLMYALLAVGLFGHILTCCLVQVPIMTEAADKKKVAINGFGRIGRNFLRCWNGRESTLLDVVAINDSGGVKQVGLVCLDVLQLAY